MPAQPQKRNTKEAERGREGKYTAHAAMEFNAEAFKKTGALVFLLGFACFLGADFYVLPRNRGTRTLIKRPLEIPAAFIFGDQEVVPLRAGGRLVWLAVSRLGVVFCVAFGGWLV